MLGFRTASAAVILLSVAGVAAGCGQGPRGEGNVGGRSGLYGTVARGPLKPTCARGKGCNGPAKKAELDFVSAGGTVTRVRTTSTGTYRAALPPGRYTIRSEVGIGGVRPTSARVRAGKFDRLALVIDTGIR